MTVFQVLRERSTREAAGTAFEGQSALDPPTPGSVSLGMEWGQEAPGVWAGPQSTEV